LRTRFAGIPKAPRPDDEPGSVGGGTIEPGGPVIERIGRAVRVAAADFLDVAVYFVLGAAITSAFNTGVRQDVILPVAEHPVGSIAAMMGLAAILSLCSTSDAFISATFVAFALPAKLAFLVFGPMMDLKLLFLYGAVFRRRFVVGLAFGLFVVIGIVCFALGLAGVI
jgi:hypothetical protein